MGTWSTEFVLELQRGTKQPRYRLERLPAFDDVGLNHWSTDSIVLDGSSTSSGAELNPVSWTSSFGTFSVAVNVTRSWLFRCIARGQVVALKVGFEGWADSQFQTVLLGQIYNLRGIGRNMVIECRDITAALRHRFSTDVNKMQLFDTADSSTTVDSDWTVGDATMDVVTTGGFEKQDDGSGTLRGLLYVTPTSGDPFFLAWTSSTGTSFTVVNSDILGTTRVDAAAGSTVVEYAYIDDHPLDMVRRVLVSTGTAEANGEYDTLPETWGFGIPQQYVDMDDIGRHKAFCNPSNDWNFYVRNEQDDGYSWLESVLSPGGFFLTMRRGQLTARCVRDPENVPPVDHITDDDIEEIEDYEAWDSSYAVEYAVTEVSTDYNGNGNLETTSSNTSDEPVTSFPADSYKQIDLTSWVFTNPGDARNDVLSRLAPWACRIPERLVLRCRGWAKAVRAPGDVVRLTTSQVSGRLESTFDGYENRLAYVLGVAPDWFGNTVKLTLAILPTARESAAK